jgi:hypothetical protein
VAASRDPNQIWCGQGLCRQRCGGKPLSGHMGSMGSAMASGRCRRACGTPGTAQPHGIRQIVCVLVGMWSCLCNKTPLGFISVHQVVFGKLQRSGGREGARRWRGVPTVGRHAPRQRLLDPRAQFRHGKGGPFVGHWLNDGERQLGAARQSRGLWRRG